MKLSANPESAMKLRFQIHGPVTFATALVGTMTNFPDQIHIEEEGVVVQTMFVDTTGVKATHFHLEETTKNVHYDIGRKAATGFLATWEFEAYKNRCPKPEEQALARRFRSSTRASEDCTFRTRSIRGRRP